MRLVSLCVSNFPARYRTEMLCRLNYFHLLVLMMKLRYMLVLGRTVRARTEVRIKSKLRIAGTSVVVFTFSAQINV